MFSAGQNQTRYGWKKIWSLGNPMKHFAIEQWVDYSRNLVEPEVRARMEDHLGSGCVACHKLAGLTDRVAVTCTWMATVEVPESAMRLARAIFPVRVPDRPRRGTRLPIELIFDSFLAPSPAGLRSTWQIGWQGMYRAGECSLDLRIEPELKSPRAAVIGQIANHIAPSLEMSNLTVSLRAGSRIVAETVSNRFGEFQLEYEQQPQLKLVVHLADSRTIQVPLKRLSINQPATKSRVSSIRR
jgi:hypothetical protein